MKIWAEHFRALNRLIPTLNSLQAGAAVTLTAPEHLDLEFEVSHSDQHGAIATLCCWFEHPSGDSFPDGGMEIKLDYQKKEMRPISIQTPTYLEEGKLLPPLDKNLDEALHQWLKALNKAGFRPKGSISRSE